MQEIWAHIHSLLPMRNAAQVACVSQDFVRSWRSRPNLIFYREALGLNVTTSREDGIMRNFVDRINNILKNHSGIGVKTLKFSFQLAFKYNNLCFLDHLDNWRQIAVKPGIEKLQLLLSTFTVRDTTSHAAMLTFIWWGGNLTSVSLPCHLWISSHSHIWLFEKLDKTRNVWSVY
jgi:hypothetical protein